MMTILLGDLKIAQKSLNLQNTCSKIQGHAFFEVAEAPQAARTQTHPDGFRLIKTHQGAGGP